MKNIGFLSANQAGFLTSRLALLGCPPHGGIPSCFGELGLGEWVLGWQSAWFWGRSLSQNQAGASWVGFIWPPQPSSMGGSDKETGILG